MAVNFCSSVYKTHIYCDKPSMDGSDIENLVKPSGPASFHQGAYLAESFIRPPVNILIEFPFCIDIRSINIQNTVGSQKSLSFEILSCSSKVTDYSLILGSMASTKKNYMEACKDRVFCPIGKTPYVERCEDYHEIHFVNSKYKPKYLLSKLVGNNEQKTSSDNILTVNLRHHQFQKISCASAIIIKILKVRSGGVPAIKRLQVWGQPSPFVPKNVIEKFQEITNQCQGNKHFSNYVSQLTTDVKEHSNEGNPHSRNKSHHSKVSTDDVGVAALLAVPGEFYDELSCQIMSMPIILPSGHIVDQSTIDKYNAEEAKWGRPPNDPFTSIPFSDDRRICFHTSLKARIDQYLLKHGNDVQTCGRTIGRASDLHNLQALQSEIYRDRDMQIGMKNATEIDVDFCFNDDKKPCTDKNRIHDTIDVNPFESVTKQKQSSCLSESEQSYSVSNYSKSKKRRLSDAKEIQLKKSLTSTGKMKQSSIDTKSKTNMEVDWDQNKKSLPRFDLSNFKSSRDKPDPSRTNRKKIVQINLEACIADKPTQNKYDMASNSKLLFKHKTNQSSENSVTSQSHENQLSQSLDFALQQTLGSLPSYSGKNSILSTASSSSTSHRQVKYHRHNKEQSKELALHCPCMDEIHRETNQLFYQLPCKHNLCRNAILEKSGQDVIVCPNCCKIWKKNEVERIHL